MSPNRLFAIVTKELRQLGRDRLTFAMILGIPALQLLLLDEPTSAVDPESRRNFWASLFELADAGTTLLVSTHYMDEAERCHRLAILERGRLVADGTPQALIASLPGRVWLLRSADTRAAESALRGQPGLIGSAQIGTSLRVLAEPGVDEAALRALLPAAQDRIEAIEPNLEDVFVAATHAARRARGEARQ